MTVWLESILFDLRFSLRMMRKTPLATSVAVLSLALAIGANVAIFTIFDALLVRSLAVKNPDEIVLLSWLSGGRSGNNFSFPVFEQLRSRADVIGFNFVDGITVIANGRADFERGEIVSGNYYAVLGVAPALGRVLSDADDRESSPPVCVISYHFWQTRLAGDPSVIGRKITFGKLPVTIVGVEPKEFGGMIYGFETPFRMPIHIFPQVIPSFTRDRFLGPDDWVGLVARVPNAQARATLAARFHQAGRELIFGPSGSGFDGFRNQFRDPVYFLAAGVALVLLIACANVANLMLARAKSRERETAMRRALGAGRIRLARQLLIESVALAAAGALPGIGLAYWASKFFAAFNEITIDVHPDLRVLAFTVAITLFTAILFGLAPAIQTARADVQPNLQRSRFSIANSLIVAQIAFSVVVVIAAGLYVRTLLNLRFIDPGMTNLTTFRIYPRSSGYTSAASATEIAERLMMRLENMAGIESVSISRFFPFDAWPDSTVDVPGLGAEKADVNMVSGRFFETMGTPLLAGHAIEARDQAVVNETFARTFFHFDSPLGKHFRVNNQNYEISGVVRDTKAMRRATPPAYFVAYEQNSALQGFAVELRSRGRGIANEIRSAVQALDPTLPIRDLETAVETQDRRTRRDRLLAGLSTIFGALALVLAAIGLYGVRAYAVTRRTGEIGIRVALGAGPGTIANMILRETAWLAFFGVSLGLAAAYLAARYIQSMLYGVAPRDLATFAAAAVIMIAVAVFAGYLPARRAARIDPMTALRHE